MAEYIDKQKLIDELDDKYSLGDIGRMEHDIIVDALLYAKPADVRPVVRGRWIDYDDDYGAYSCSECEQNAPEDTQWNFCPHCGTDMRGCEE